MASAQNSTSASPVKDAFQEAFRKFEARLNKKERDQFKITTLQELQVSLLQLQSKQVAKSQAMNLSRVVRFLDAFKQFGQIVEVFLNTSPFVAFIWGPMKFLLQVASNFTDAFDILVDAYKQIGESMPLLEQYRALFTGDSHVDELLVFIYEDILNFHQRALRFFSMPTWRKVFHSVWNDFKARFRGILQDLRRHRELIESQATALHFHQYQMDRQMSIEKWKSVETAERDRKYSEVMQWFTGADVISDHEDVRRLWEGFPGSGKWLLKHPHYSNWREDPDPKLPTLWLSGIPGAGKTVLASAVIENCKGDKDTHTAFCYCKHDDPQRNTSVTVMRMLLSQLLRHDHVLVPWCYELYLNRGPLSLSSGDFCKTILEAILTINDGQKTFLVIDGVDECDKKEIKALLHILRAVVDICDLRNPGNLRVMIASQDQPEIRTNLPAFTELSLKVINNESDIQKYVDVWCDKIQAKFELDKETRDYIFESTCHRAQGMFLFVRLVLVNLCDQTCLSDLREEVKPHRFPPGLEEAYERIVDRINHHPQTKATVARDILQLMTFARRPLKWHEIQGALSIRTEDLSLEFVNRKPRVHISEICGPLINQLTGDRLELVHSSAKSYLIKIMFVQPSIPECHLSALCLNYLCFEYFDLDSTEAAQEVALLDGCYAFQDYAITHWSDHLSCVIKEGPDGPLSEFLHPDGDLQSGLTNFAAKYRLYEPQSDEIAKNSGGCAQFSRFDFFEDLCYTFRHIQQQRAKGFDGLDEISPSPLDQVLAVNRKILEGLEASKFIQPEKRDQLQSFYGSKWYKCSRATCFYFHEGFKDGKSRDFHVLRHERPFRCTSQDCGMAHKHGFTKRKDLESHMKIYHPESGSSPATFSRLRKAALKDHSSDGRPPSRTKNPATYECSTCPKKFTRSSNLRSHQYSHKNEKPFACDSCGSTFARKSDRERHQKIHDRGREKSNLQQELLEEQNRSSQQLSDEGSNLEVTEGHSLLEEQRRARLQLPHPHSEFEPVDWHRLLDEEPTRRRNLPPPQIEVEHIELPQLLESTEDTTESAQMEDISVE